jgi:hypothetical protein
MTSVIVLRSILLLAASSSVASEIFNHFVTRQRNRKVESVDKLVRICSAGTTRTAVISVLRQLEAAGLGTFVAGRRGHASRFEWKTL